MFNDSPEVKASTTWIEKRNSRGTTIRGDTGFTGGAIIIDAGALVAEIEGPEIKY